VSTLSAALVPAETREDWNRFVDRHPDALSWHGYDWSRFLSEHYNIQFLPLAAFEGPEIRAILPLYRIKTRRTGAMLISIPYFVAGGIIADSAEAEELLVTETLSLSRTHEAPAFLKTYRAPAPGPFKTDSSFYNRELDASPGVAAVWDNLEQVNRDRIEVSSRLDVAVEYPSHRVDDFYRLMAGHEHSLGRPWVSRKWLNSLLATGMYKPAVLTLRGTPATATLVKRYKDTVSFPLTCLRQHDELTETLACRLYWELIQQLAPQGIRIFHSGRIPADGSVPAYRLGWGGTPYHYHYQYYGREEEKTDSEVRSGSMRGRFERIWPRIPRPVAGLIAPAIVKQFP
jgi:hypothetical protein